MRIAILTSGRFHVCDLARELDARGHEVHFYSLVAPARTARFGLPARCNRWLLPFLAPLYGLSAAAAKTRWRSATNHLLTVALDRVAMRRMEACDVFIGMSSLCLATMEHAQRRFGAVGLLERGSRHIVSQRAILESLGSGTRRRPPVPEWAVQRELAEYSRAQVIVVPSKHAERSFVECGVPVHKLFRNPYGVDLNMFPQTVAPPAETPPTVLMVGAWSLQKGCDVLVEAWRPLAERGVRLLHVGPLVDAALPRHPLFEHHGPVDQARLTQWYGRAHVKALASRQDGLGLVLSQALASGLPVVATDATGAEDLQEVVADLEAIAITAANDVAGFTAALTRQLTRAQQQVGRRDLLGTGRSRLSWRAYGERYDRMLRGMRQAAADAA